MPVDNMFGLMSANFEFIGTLRQILIFVGPVALCLFSVIILKPSRLVSIMLLFLILSISHKCL